MSQNDKSALLNALKLDKEEKSEELSFSVPWFKVASVCALLIAIIYFSVAFFSNKTTKAVTLEQQNSLANTSGENDQSISNSKESGSKASDLKAPIDTSVSQEILNASGYVTARLMATVSAEVMGRLKTVDVEEGMRVERGQVLATVDDTLARLDWTLSIEQTRSLKQRLLSLNTELSEVQRVLARVQSLDKKSFTSDAELTRAQSNVDKLNADILSLEADLRVSVLRAERQKEILDDHTIRAPFSGVVTVKNAQAGEIVAPSSAGGGFTRTGICTIVDMESLEIEVDVNEAYIGRVFENQKINAQLDAYPKWDIPAAVIAVIPTADRSKATVRVRVAILEKDIRILPEMGVKVTFYKN